MTPTPDFDDLIGRDVPPEERARLHRTHELLVQAGPPPELSPEQESVPWPDEALQPLATAAVVGFLLGQINTSSPTSIHAERTVQLHGTALAQGALATLKLGKPDSAGNWPMVLEVSGLPKLAKGGYYDLYLTKGGVPLVSCGTINVNGMTSATVRLSAAYVLEAFDKNGWVIVRKTPANHFRPTQVVLSAT